MMDRELISSAIQSLKGNPMRTLLTMLGIIIGISSVILIVSIGQGAVAFITDELTSFGTNYFAINPGTSAIASFAGGEKTLTLSDAEAIRNDTSLGNVDVVAATAVVSTVVSANDVDKTILVQGVNYDVVDLYKPDMLYGDFISNEDDLEAKRVVVLGKSAAETFFGPDADPVGQKITIDQKSFLVIGVAESSSVLAGGVFNSSVYIPVSVALHQLTGPVNIGEIDVSVKHTDTINQTIEDVTALLRERHNLKAGSEDDFIIQSFQDALTTVQTITNLLTLMVAAISGISLVVGGVGVMNIMLVSVTERTREIGLLKAIGARDHDILNQFLIEAVVMTMIGGVIGIGLGVLGALGVSLLVHIPFVVSAVAVVAAVSVAAGVGVVFGLYPARRAAKLAPIDALRHE